MTILKYMNLSELETRQSEIRLQIARAEERLRTQPIPSPGYNRRNDLSLSAELHKYLAEINAEIVRRHTGAPNS